MNLIIREISPSDYLRVIEVIKKSNKESLGKIYPVKLINEFSKKYDLDSFKIKAQEIKYFIAEDIETKYILGVIGLKSNELRTFFVDPNYQGKGVGRKLYNYLEEVAKKNGIKELILEGSPLGEPIYKHLGFQKLKTIQKERVGIKYTDAYMVKKLE